MNFTSTTVASNPKILKRMLGGELMESVTIASAAFTNGVCKAGSPISAAGLVSNTSSAVGILLNDVYSTNPNGSILKAFGIVNLANAKSNSGLTIDATVKTALSSIAFE